MIINKSVKPRTYEQAITDVQRICFPELIENIFNEALIFETEIADILGIKRKELAEIRRGAEPTFNQGQDLLNLHHLTCRRLHKLDNICE